MIPIPKQMIEDLFEKMIPNEVELAMIDFYRRFHRPITKEELVRHYA